MRRASIYASPLYHYIKALWRLSDNERPILPDARRMIFAHLYLERIINKLARQHRQRHARRRIRRTPLPCRSCSKRHYRYHHELKRNDLSSIPDSRATCSLFHLPLRCVLTMKEKKVIIDRAPALLWNKSVNIRMRISADVDDTQIEPAK